MRIEAHDTVAKRIRADIETAGTQMLEAGIALKESRNIRAYARGYLRMKRDLLTADYLHRKSLAERFGVHNAEDDEESVID